MAFKASRGLDKSGNTMHKPIQLKQHQGTNSQMCALIQRVFWNCRGSYVHNNILVASILPIVYLIFLVETREKDGIRVATILGCSRFSSAQQGFGNIQLGTITRGHECIVVFIRKSICRGVSYLLPLS
jgi:hypothetical protein